MRRIFLAPAFAAFAVSAVAQQPPAALPGSITGNTRAVPVVPAAATVPAGKPPPVARFTTLANFPPETVQAVVAVRTAGEWLARMQQPHGRFLIGLNPAVKLPLDRDDDFRQAWGTLGLCQAARFTGDAKLTAAAEQAVLAVRMLTKDDPADAAAKLPDPRTACNKVGFAAVLVLAISELPTADAKLVQDADKLCVFLRKQVQADGAVKCGDGPADVEGTNLVPGLVLQALAANSRAAPDAGKREILLRGLACYRAKFRAAPHPTLAGSVIPAAVECFTQTPDKDAAATALEMADWLCAAQLGRGDGRQLAWVGGFRTGGDGSEPGYESAYAARGLAAATFLTRQLPDATRYAKYRQATADALGFCGGLQYTAENTDHFEGKFRAHYLVGGVRLGATDGTLRVDATAAGLGAALRFLESGAETRE